MNYKHTSPTHSDIPAVFDLISACDLALYNEPETEIEELPDEWADIDLEQDAWLVFDEANTLIGYAAVFDNDSQISFDFYTRPAHNLTELKATLIAQCEARARQILAQSKRDGEVILKSYLAHQDQISINLIEQAEYTPRKYHFRMQLDYNGPPQSLQWPQGSHLRTFIPDQDDRMVYDFIQTAFDWPGRITSPFEFEQWHKFMLGAYNFNPDLWFLLFQEEELIGAALCFEYELGGWIRQLGVAKAWRKQGIGSALLKHVFGIFYQRGKSNTALGVEANNPNAYAFYERVGMQKTRQFDEYYKLIQE